MLQVSFSVCSAHLLWGEGGDAAHRCVRIARDSSPPQADLSPQPRSRCIWVRVESVQRISEVPKLASVPKRSGRTNSTMIQLRKTKTRHATAARRRRATSSPSVQGVFWSWWGLCNASVRCRSSLRRRNVAAAQTPPRPNTPPDKKPKNTPAVFSLPSTPPRHGQSPAPAAQKFGSTASPG